MADRSEKYKSGFSGSDVDAAVRAVMEKESEWDAKQDKLAGEPGQVVGFDEAGNAVPQSTDSLVGPKGDPGDAAAGSGGEIYSTEEIRIGTWIDGKPLYRKVITGTVPKHNTGWGFVTEFPISEMETCVSISSTMLTDPVNTGTKWVSAPNQHVAIGLNEENCVGAINNQYVYNTSPIIYIVEYTKTTDQADFGGNSAGGNIPMKL